MARFPIVQRMCPYRATLADIMDGELCRMCHRQVHDLTAMSDAQRQAFLDSCSQEVCVSYSLPRSSKIAAAALSAAMIALPAAAEESAPVPDTARAESNAKYAGIEEQELAVLVIGGIKDPSKVRYVQDADDAELPDLPVTYEDSED